MFKNRAVALALSAKSHDIANLTKLSNQENENRKTVHTRRRGGAKAASGKAEHTVRNKTNQQTGNTAKHRATAKQEREAHS